MKEKLLKQFGTIVNAEKQLGVTRATIYTAIKSGYFTDIVKDRIKGRGFNPDSFQPLNQK